MFTCASVSLTAVCKTHSTSGTIKLPSRFIKPREGKALFSSVIFIPLYLLYSSLWNCLHIESDFYSLTSGPSTLEQPCQWEQWANSTLKQKKNYLHKSVFIDFIALTCVFNIWQCTRMLEWNLKCFSSISSPVFATCSRANAAAAAAVRKKRPPPGFCSAGGQHLPSELTSTPWKEEWEETQRRKKTTLKEDQMFIRYRIRPAS